MLRLVIIALLAMGLPELASAEDPASIDSLFCRVFEDDHITECFPISWEVFGKEVAAGAPTKLPDGADSSRSRLLSPVLFWFQNFLAEERVEQPIIYDFPARPLVTNHYG